MRRGLEGRLLPMLVLLTIRVWVRSRSRMSPYFPDFRSAFGVSLMIEYTFVL